MPDDRIKAFFNSLLARCSHFVTCRTFNQWSFAGFNYERRWRQPVRATPSDLRDEQCEQVDLETVEKKYSTSFYRTTKDDRASGGNTSSPGKGQTLRQMMASMVLVPDRNNRAERALTQGERRAITDAVAKRLQLSSAPQLKWLKLRYAAQADGKTPLIDPRVTQSGQNDSAGGSTQVLYAYCGLVKVDNGLYKGFTPYRAVLADGPKGATAAVIGWGLGAESSPLSRATVTNCQKFGYFD